MHLETTAESLTPAFAHSPALLLPLHATPTTCPHTARARVWLYKDHEGAASSWEKYTVVEAENTMITIEMSTKFPGGGDDYLAHHKYGSLL